MKKPKRLKKGDQDIGLQKKNVSTNDAKALKPDILETNHSPLQINDWHRKWEKYMLASGWGQRENHKTQLAYLHTVVSNDIRMAINFYGIRTVQNAHHQIRDYLNMPMIPLTLQRLEMI